MYNGSMRSEVKRYVCCTANEAYISNRLEGNRNGTLTPEELQELRGYTRLEHLMRLVKLRAYEYSRVHDLSTPRRLSRNCSSEVSKEIVEEAVFGRDARLCAPRKHSKPYLSPHPISFRTRVREPDFQTQSAFCSPLMTRTRRG